MGFMVRCRVTGSGVLEVACYFGFVAIAYGLATSMGVSDTILVRQELGLEDCVGYGKEGRSLLVVFHNWMLWLRIAFGFQGLTGDV